MKKNYEAVKAWRKKNKDKVNEQARRYRARHPETGIKAKAKYRVMHLEEVREKDRAYHQSSRYKEAQKIRNLRYRARYFAEQEELAGRPRPDTCELCGEKAKTVFDHCHNKGHFRGWICDRCNRVLGSVKDDIVLLELMVKYLEENDGKTIDSSKKTDTKE